MYWNFAVKWFKIKRNKSYTSVVLFSNSILTFRVFCRLLKFRETQQLSLKFCSCVSFIWIHTFRLHQKEQSGKQVKPKVTWVNLLFTATLLISYFSSLTWLTYGSLTDVTWWCNLIPRGNYLNTFLQKIIALENSLEILKQFIEVFTFFSLQSVSIFTCKSKNIHRILLKDKTRPTRQDRGTVPARNFSYLWCVYIREPSSQLRLWVEDKLSSQHPLLLKEYSRFWISPKLPYGDL